jgi:hypothetical protein
MPRQHPDRVDRGAPVPARMEVLVRPRDRDLLAEKPAQHRGDRRGLVVEEPGVADEREVGAHLVRVLLQERHKRGRARFLLALEEEGDPAGKPALHRDPGAAGLDEGHELALVVRRAPPADHAALRPVLERGVEGVAVPERQRVHRLHVVMPVEQEMRPPSPIWPTTIGCPVVGRFSAGRRARPAPPRASPPRGPHRRHMQGRSRSTGCAEAPSGARSRGAGCRRWWRAPSRGSSRGLPCAVIAAERIRTARPVQQTRLAEPRVSR